MTRLTDKQYWEVAYTAATSHAETPQRTVSRMKRLLKRVIGKRLFDFISPYDDYLLWRVVFQRYLPASCDGLSVIEIGSAPGDFLVRFAKTFGATPYGVEYTHKGAEINRYNFIAHGLDPGNVIEADFFSKEFLDAYRERFDIVISRGFIEHFADVESVIAQHLAVLRPGGLLVVIIPNLRGIYGAWTRRFNPEQMPLHNLDIMELSRFCSLFGEQPLETKMCGYFGTFSFWLFTAPRDAGWANKFIRLLLVLQRGLNLAFRVLFRRNGFETSTFSPNILYIGRKLGA